MAIDQRHEEDTNLLIRLATSHNESIRTYVTAVIAIALLVGAGLFSYTYVKSQREKTASQGWRQFFTSVDFRDIEGLEELGTGQMNGAGPWAMQTAGDLHLATGTEILLRNRELGLERLRQASDSYQAAFDRAENDMLRQRALLGMAQAKEALGEYESAAENYRDFLKRWPEGALAKVAQDRLRLLDQPSTQEFYTWLLEQKPRVAPSQNTGNQRTGPTPPANSPFNSGLLDPSRIRLPESTGTAEDPNAKSFDEEFLEGLEEEAAKKAAADNSPPSAEKTDDAAEATEAPATQP